jgi:hypothetical protein
MDYFSYLSTPPQKTSSSSHIHSKPRTERVSEIDIVKSAFELVKVSGFNSINLLCDFFQNRSTVEKDIVEKETVEKFVGTDRLNSTALKVLNSLNSKGWIKIQEIVSQTKNGILVNFKEGGDRNKEVHVFHERPNSLTVKAKEDGFYLMGGSIFSASFKLFTYPEFFSLCDADELTGLNLSQLPEMSGPDFTNKNLTSTIFDGSDMTGAKFDGAIQENMSVCGTTLNGATGFQLLPTTKLDENTKFRGTEILFDGWKNQQSELTGSKLTDFLNLIDRIKDTHINGKPLNIVLMLKLIASLEECDINSNHLKKIVEFFLDHQHYLEDKKISEFVMQCVSMVGEPNQQEKFLTIKGNLDFVLLSMLSEDKLVSDAAARLYLAQKNLFSRIELLKTHLDILENLKDNEEWDKNLILNNTLEKSIKSDLEKLIVIDNSALPSELPLLLHNNLLHYINANKEMSGEITDDDITRTLRHLYTKLAPDEQEILQFYKANGQISLLKDGIRTFTPVNSPVKTKTVNRSYLDSFENNQY